MSIFKRAVVVAIVLAVAGCSSKYRVDDYEGPAAKLDSSATFYVPLPANGQYGDIVYESSGQQTASALSAALLTHVDRATIGTEPGESIDEAIATAKQLGLTNVLHATIVHWEDRATEWSMITDKLTLRLAVYEVATGAELASTVSRASTKWASWGGDHPQDLLPEAARRFVDTLF